MGVSATKVLIVLFVLCVVFFIVSLVLTFLIFPKMSDLDVDKDMLLVQSTIHFEEFTRPNFDYFKVYLFNIVNPLDVVDYGSQPVVQQVGPFVYREYRHKTVINSDSEEGTVTYTERRALVFDKEASFPLDEDYEVTVLNLPMMYILQAAEKDLTGPTANDCILDIFPGEISVLMKVKSKDLLFDGFNFCQSQTGSVCSFVNNYFCSFLPSSTKYFNTLQDGSLQFSYFGHMQKTNEDRYTLNTGFNNMDDLGKILKWNDQEYTNFWGNESECSQVTDSRTTEFPPRLSKNDLLSIFSTDMCRSLEFNYAEDITYRNMNSYLFDVNLLSLNSTYANVEEDCFCSEEVLENDGTESCFLDGVINLQSCNGLPILGSFPHFLSASEKYRLVGLNPNEEQHKSFLLLEPETGTTLKYNLKTQLNYQIAPTPSISKTKNLPDAVIPILWIEKDFTQSSNYLDVIEMKYFEQTYFLDTLGWVLVGISTGAVFLTFGILIYRNCFQHK